MKILLNLTTLNFECAETGQSWQLLKDLRDLICYQDGKLFVGKFVDKDVTWKRKNLKENGYPEYLQCHINNTENI